MTEPNAPSGRIRHLAVALDTSDRETFSRWCRTIGPRVEVLKVGLEAFVRWGAAAVHEARSSGAEVFLDLKLHDIPNTMAAAAAAARSLDVRYLTVHAAAGPAALEATVEAAGEELRLLAVTLLTHLDHDQLASLDLAGQPAERVEAWARLAQRSGCAGAVCSPLEVAALRQSLPSPFVLVTPGIRPAGDAAPADDQRRTATPAAAMTAGADLLVIGRPITRADDPAAALAAIASELSRRS